MNIGTLGAYKKITYQADPYEMLNRILIST